MTKSKSKKYQQANEHDVGQENAGGAWDRWMNRQNDQASPQRAAKWPERRNEPPNTFSRPKNPSTQWQEQDNDTASVSSSSSSSGSEDRAIALALGAAQNIGFGVVVYDLETIHNADRGTYAARGIHECSYDEQMIWKSKSQIIEFAAVEVISGQQICVQCRP